MVLQRRAQFDLIREGESILGRFWEWLGFIAQSAGFPSRPGCLFWMDMSLKLLQKPNAIMSFQWTVQHLTIYKHEFVLRSTAVSLVSSIVNYNKQCARLYITIKFTSCSDCTSSLPVYLFSLFIVSPSDIRTKYLLLFSLHLSIIFVVGKKPQYCTFVIFKSYFDGWGLTLSEPVSPDRYTTPHSNHSRTLFWRFLSMSSLIKQWNFGNGHCLLRQMGKFSGTSVGLQYL